MIGLLKFKSIGLLKSNDRFFWNSYLMTRLKESAKKVNEIGRFILPIVCGFFFTKTIAYRQQFSYYLISRRSRFRAGARYHSRGIDEEGNVSNFVETEQVVICNGLTYSYVQLRGSIPLFWQQQVGLGYKPKLVLDTRQDTVNDIC
jgi:phosphatidylinositol 4-phosphatase